MKDATKPAIAKLPTEYGNFNVIVWPEQKGYEPIAITTPKLDINKPVLVRIHSECLTGDVFGSLRCDCGPQRSAALSQIADSKNGVFIYLRQEGRGIGLHEKIRSYALQEKGYDTHEASIKLGHQPDSRDYTWAKSILDYLGIKKIKLLTNNPAKISEIFNGGFDVEKIPLVIQPTSHSHKYFKTKQDKFKHIFDGSHPYCYFGITYLNYQNNIKELLKFLKNKRKHPFVKIHIGLYLNDEILNSTSAISRINKIFSEISLVTDIIPVVHYNPASPVNCMAGVDKINTVFPTIKHIQINDITPDFLPIILKAAQNFTLIVPLNNRNFGLLDNRKFREVVLKYNAFLLLDNSGGKGQKETFAAYQSKINRCISLGLNNIGLAGGFGPDSLDVFFEIQQYFKFNFSIDAESRLQTKGQLDVKKAIKYFDRLLNT